MTARKAGVLERSSQVPSSAPTIIARFPSAFRVSGWLGPETRILAERTFFLEVPGLGEVLLQLTPAGL